MEAGQLGATNQKSNVNDEHVNVLKVIIGSTNATFGLLRIINGTIVVIGSTGVGAVSPPVGSAGTAAGAYQVATGVATLRRGLEQINTAGATADNPNNPHAKNLLGLLPFGQKFDDINEPYPVEYGLNTLRNFLKDPGRNLGKGSSIILTEI